MNRRIQWRRGPIQDWQVAIQRLPGVNFDNLTQCFGDTLVAQAIVDPEQLRQFAMMLKRFNDSLTESGTRVSQEVGRLGTTWRDQEHQKFTTEFEQDLKQLKKISDSCERHIPYLLRKAELIEEYQRNG